MSRRTYRNGAYSKTSFLKNVKYPRERPFIRANRIAGKVAREMVLSEQDTRHRYGTPETYHPVCILIRPPPPCSIRVDEKQRNPFPVVRQERDLFDRGRSGEEVAEAAVGLVDHVLFFEVHVVAKFVDEGF